MVNLFDIYADYTLDDFKRCNDELEDQYGAVELSEHLRGKVLLLSIITFSETMSKDDKKEARRIYNDRY